jgi:yeeF1
LFGGPSELDNLVSQAEDVNLKEYRRIERDWADALKSDPPKKVEVDIKINYEGTSMRPSSFEVNYKIDGIEYFEEIPNINRGAVK